MYVVYRGVRNIKQHGVIRARALENFGPYKRAEDPDSTIYTGVNIAKFCKEFNERTKHFKEGYPTPIDLYIKPDRYISTIKLYFS